MDLVSRGNRSKINSQLYRVGRKLANERSETGTAKQITYDIFPNGAITWTSHLQTSSNGVDKSFSENIIFWMNEFLLARHFVSLFYRCLHVAINAAADDVKKSNLNFIEISFDIGKECRHRAKAQNPNCLLRVFCLSSSREQARHRSIGCAMNCNRTLCGINIASN